MSKQQMREKFAPGGIFLGCMFLGIGVGIITGARQAGTMIGMGVGFLLMALIQLNAKPKNEEIEY
jgi:hypothetical protein